MRMMTESAEVVLRHVRAVWVLDLERHMIYGWPVLPECEMSVRPSMKSKYEACQRPQDSLAPRDPKARPLVLRWRRATA